MKRIQRWRAKGWRMPDGAVTSRLGWWSLLRDARFRAGLERGLADADAGRLYERCGDDWVPCDSWRPDDPIQPDGWRHDGQRWVRR